MIAPQILYMMILLCDVEGVLVVDKKKLDEVKMRWRLFSESVNVKGELWVVLEVARVDIIAGVPVPNGAGFVVWKWWKFCGAACKSSSNTVVKTCIVAGHVENFEK